MRTIEQRLDDAAEGLRELSREIPDRRWVEPAERFRSGLVAGTAGAVLVLIVLGVPALLIATQNPSDGEDMAGTADDVVVTSEAVETTAQSNVGQFGMLTIRHPGWSHIDVTDRRSDQAGGSLSITFRETTEDASGNAVVIEVGREGAWLKDFLAELEADGVEEERTVAVRGQDGILRMSATGLWGLQWAEPGADGLLLLVQGTDPQVLVDLAAFIEPLNEGEWTEMVMQSTATTISQQDPIDEPGTSDEIVVDALLSSLPDGFDLLGATPIFSGQGSAAEVALGYLADRLPDSSSLGVRLDSVEPAAEWLLARWVWGDPDGESGSGYLILFEDDHGVDVLAATTDGVDLSGLSLQDGRLRGSVVTGIPGTLGADVVNNDGQPVSGSPYPDGFIPEADYRWGTAGSSDSGSLTLDIGPISGPVAVRINLVGGTLLSISELMLGGSE